MLEDHFKPIYHKKLDVYCWYVSDTDDGMYLIPSVLYELLDPQVVEISIQLCCKAYKTESAAYKDLDIAIHRCLLNFLAVVDYLPRHELEKLKEKICVCIK